MATLNNIYTDTPNINNYLKERNQKYYRGHSNFVHPLYEKELKNAISSINNFLNLSILKYAYFKRLRAIYSLSAEKCYNPHQNNYSFSEAEVCEELMMEKDVILAHLNDFPKEVEVRIQDLYEKQVKYAPGNNPDSNNFNPRKYELDHRKFLLRLNFMYRYYYYFTAKKMFVDSTQ